MLVYRDLFSSDELCSDIYPKEVLDGVIIDITGKLTVETLNLDGCNFGANASEETPDEGGVDDPTAIHGIDVVIANRLIETGFTKKDYMIYIKKYIGRIVAKLEEAETCPQEVAHIKKGLAVQVKTIVGDFKEYQFFMGESADEDGMMIPMKYMECKVKPGTHVPHFYFFKHGIIEEKV